MDSKNYTSVKAKGWTWNLSRFRAQIRQISLEEGVEVAFETLKYSKMWKVKLPCGVWNGLLWVPNSPLKFSPHRVVIVENNEVNYGEYSYQTNKGSEPEFNRFNTLIDNLETPADIEMERQSREIKTVNPIVDPLLDITRPLEYETVGSVKGPLEGVIAAAKKIRESKIGALHVVEERLDTYLK